MSGITLRTVAREAGVSTTTVSNAYNRPDQLSADLRERVLQTARRLGYAGPDATARSLRRGRAGAVGVLFTETLSYALSDPYATEFLRGMAAVAEGRGTALLLIPVDEADPDAARAAARQAVVDGFCLECVSEDSPVLDAILGRGLPTVSTSELPGRDTALVTIDERGAARSAAEHLARLGHERVSVVVDGRPPFGTEGPLTVSEALEHAVDGDTRLRLAGFREGLPDAELDVVAARRNTRVDGRVAAATALDRRDRPTAILTVSDVLAAGALEVVRERGLRPGIDVSVVGFDDMPIAADHGLTTVRQDAFAKGRLAALHLLAPDEVAERRSTLATELVVRSSTGPAPRSPDRTARTTDPASEDTTDELEEDPR